MSRIQLLVGAMNRGRVILKWHSLQGEAVWFSAKRSVKNRYSDFEPLFGNKCAIESQDPWPGYARGPIRNLQKWRLEKTMPLKGLE